MFRTVKHVAASLALAGLVLSQPALAVRSSDSLPSAQATAVNARVGTPEGSYSSLHGNSPLVGYLIAAGISIGVIAIIISKHHHHKSPG